jgi:hypothetical protein
MAGYSGSTLVKKLGIVEGASVLAVGAPPGYRKLLEPLPASVRFVSRLDAATDVVHLFVTKRASLARALAGYRAHMAPNAAVWVSWPKKASGVPTEITEDVVREVALPLGLVDVKVCAVDDVWSGLKLVVRRTARAGATAGRPGRAARRPSG